jgi:hypothetical protein
LRLLEVTFDAMTPTLFDFEFGEVMQVLAESPPFALSLLRNLCAIANEAW